MPYSPMWVRPMREEVTEVGFQEVFTPEDVDKFFANKTGSALLFFNSVCGCASGVARPALCAVIKSKPAPDRWVSVFAGQDLEATARARNYIPDIPPSSPSIALFKNGELVYFVPKHRIEMRDPNAVANDLTEAFKECL